MLSNWQATDGNYADIAGVHNDTFKNLENTVTDV